MSGVVISAAVKSEESPQGAVIDVGCRLVTQRLNSAPAVGVVCWVEENVFSWHVGP